ncbi:S-adenosyl-L-methionine-dependent methyltransferase [Laetiporus sulphureus 93-53]|uniref:S-adenosyl-L-methionine-dependent methyltransferase n=1 Tax=Laetiporus sulphureus 93-53 TaxID=1314785 RepID=A0A165H2C2_9APHY|nr:S-adenosyl-L-methionine-dependent methyltransferase [Laetiporus sulphureus 93-53]KZT11148.1 S-adenosyl-L-methionine-dependent methyltransferase [Laetiporus sulphureus 93-53]
MSSHTQGSHEEIHADGPHDHYAAENKAFYDVEEARKVDARRDTQELARRVAAAMRRRYPDIFNEETTTLMDYACGTGLVSRELCPYVKSIVGVDISDGMVDQFNLRVSQQGLTPEEMKAVCVELKGEEHELDGQKFDVIVCSMAFHHFSSYRDVTRMLAFFLKPGGSLLVVDIVKGTLKAEISAHHERIIAHQHGFDTNDMREAFETAGLIAFDYSLATSGKMHGNTVDFFLARGKKPALSPTE